MTKTKPLGPEDGMSFLNEAFKNHAALRAATLKFSDISMYLPLMYHEIRMQGLNKQIDHVVELGTRLGESTTALVAAVADVNSIQEEPAAVTCVDIDAECLDSTRQRVGDPDFLRTIASDSLAEDLKFPEESIDFLLIDTSHTYEQTLGELIKFAPYVKRDGVIWLHDTRSCEGVPKAIEAFNRDRKFPYFECPSYAGLGWLVKN